MLSSGIQANAKEVAVKPCSMWRPRPQDGLPTAECTFT